MNYGYIPVPQGKTLKAVRKVTRRKVRAPRNAVTLPAYTTAEECKARHPDCEPWRVPLVEVSR